MKLQYQTCWNNDAAPADHQREPYLMQERAPVDWINGLYADVYRASGGTPDPVQDPTGTVDGCSVNDPDSALGSHADGRIDQALWLYDGDNDRRHPRNLVAVKRRWDPGILFHHAQLLPVV